MNLKLNNELVIRTVAGESVAVPTGKLALRMNGILSLTPSGRLLAEKLREGCGQESLVNCLLEAYEVDEPQARRDVDVFLDKLRDLGVLQ